MRLSKISIVAAIVCMTMAGCTCERRMLHLQRNCPDCFSTQRIIDTVIMPMHKLDTVMVLDAGWDDIHVSNDKATIDIERHQSSDGDSDTIYIYCTVPPDTIIKTRDVPVPTPSTSKHSKFRESRLRLVILLSLSLIIVHSIKHRKK